MPKTDYHVRARRDIPPVRRTRKRPGDWVQTHDGFIKLGETR